MDEWWEGGKEGRGGQMIGGKEGVRGHRRERETEGDEIR